LPFLKPDEPIINEAATIVKENLNTNNTHQPSSMIQSFNSSILQQLLQYQCDNLTFPSFNYSNQLFNSNNLTKIPSLLENNTSTMLSTTAAPYIPFSSANVSIPVDFIPSSQNSQQQAFMTLASQIQSQPQPQSTILSSFPIFALSNASLFPQITNTTVTSQPPLQNNSLTLNITPNENNIANSLMSQTIMLTMLPSANTCLNLNPITAIPHNSISLSNMLLPQTYHNSN
jgi:uncharacterized membrane protein